MEIIKCFKKYYYRVLSNTVPYIEVSRVSEKLAAFKFKVD